MRFSERGLDLCAEFEGLRLVAYLCPAQVWTIGYGHTKGVKPGDKITIEQARAYLREDAKEAEDAVNQLVKVSLTQGQFDALVDFVFNLGRGAFTGSTLLKMINMGRLDGARLEFVKWNKAGGKVLDGLTRRRVAEQKMFV